jgi:hypothetical protein
MKKIKIFYPFLFAIYPILFLLGHNIEQLTVSEILIIFAGTLLVVKLFLMIFTAIFRDKHKAGMYVSFLAILFFSYGHIYEFFDKKTAMADMVRHSQILLPYLGVMLSGVIIIECLCRRKKYMTKVLNLVSCCLLVPSLLNISVGYAQKIFFDGSSLGGREASLGVDAAISRDSYYPDIYHITVDGYARGDILKEVYNYDNSDFLDFLRENGFYVADKSSSNYSTTFLSFYSVLNMEYFDTGKEGTVANQAVRDWIYNGIKNNRVLQLVRQAGFKYVHFNAPFSVVATNPYADVNVTTIWVNEVASIFIRTTLLRVFESKFGFLRKSTRDGILNTFDRLEDVVLLEGPKFVFVHIIAPHPPFIFRADGSLNSEAKFELDGNVWKDKEGYIGQLRFVNVNVRNTISYIMKNSIRPPVIVLHSDHGPDALRNAGDVEKSYLERMSILKAFYFPDGDYSELYEFITPVNSFRVVMNKYLGLELDLLSDKKYFLDHQNVFDLTDVTKIVSDY